MPRLFVAFDEVTEADFLALVLPTIVKYIEKLLAKSVKQDPFDAPWALFLSEFFYLLLETLFRKKADAWRDLALLLSLKMAGDRYSALAQLEIYCLE